MSFTQLTERAWGPLAQVFLPVRGLLVPLALSGVVEVGRRACRRALLARLAARLARRRVLAVRLLQVQHCRRQRPVHLRARRSPRFLARRPLRRAA